MSQKNKNNTKNQKTRPEPEKEMKKTGNRSYTGEIITCILALPVIFTLISLVTYFHRFFSGSKNIQENFFTGSLGYDCAHSLNNFFGIVSFYIPIMVIIFAIVFFLKKQLWKHILLNVLNFFMLLPFLSMITDSYSLNKTNWLGHFIYQDFFEKHIGRPGFILLFVCWAILFAILVFRISFFNICSKIFLGIKAFFEENKLFEDDDDENEKTENDTDAETVQNNDEGGMAITISPEKLSENYHSENLEPVEIHISSEKSGKYETEIPEEEPAPEEAPAYEDNIPAPEEKEENQPVEVAASEVNQPVEVTTSEVNQSQSDKSVVRTLKNYHLPPLSLLVTGENLEKSEKREQEVAATCRIIERKLGEYKIKVKVQGATIGPVVTMYEIELCEGIRVNQVVNMAQDLTVAVSGKKVRIVESIPGKPYIGIEVPNEERLTIRLKSILESPLFANAAKKGLPIALGLDVAGKPCVANLNKMPHVLVAGTTGSGKSVGINSFVLSMLYTLTPDEVKFIMIDPKGNEFNMYEGIPHMLLPVVVDSKKAAKALQWAVMEMDNRFKILAENKVKDIGEYNEKIDEINKNLANEEPKLTKMPFIVVVIDEFADLMMVAGKDVEIAVARIAQKARAVGIHLIIATQKPTRDVVTGLIKSNLPVRIAFKVASAIDSRIILDTNGAEALLGNGDMLYIPPGSSIPTRIHGAFVSTAEMEAVINFIKEEAGGDVECEDILENFQNENSSQGGSSSGGNDSDDEPLYDQILEFIIESGTCSASMLQRKFRLGYNRAARIVDRFEAEGIIGPGVGSKPRVVLRKK